MNSKKLRKILSGVNIGLCISFAVIITLSIAFAGTLSKYSVSKNSEARAFSELQSASEMQASTLIYNLNSQYLQLQVIAEMLANGEAFADENTQNSLNAMVSTYNLCMLGFADMQGNVTSYKGEAFGNISDRSYFLDIVNGKSTQCCEYLPSNKLSGSPRIMFSVPVYQNGNVTGVLFCSKEIAVLEHVLFGGSEIYESDFDIFVCDASGNLIVSTPGADEAFMFPDHTHNAFNVYEANPQLDINCFADTGKQKVNSQYGETYIVCSTPPELNQWSLFLIQSADSAAALHHENTSRVRSMSTYLTLIFISALAYIVCIAFILLKRQKQSTLAMQRSYDNYKTLLKKMHCVVFEYDINTRHIALIQSSPDIFNPDVITGTSESYMRYKEMHPEFDFNSLEREIAFIRNAGTSSSVESILATENGEYRWLKIILVPVLNEDEKVNKIFCVILDISDMHREFDELAETISTLPGGIHRCYLNEPIHLEYYSDGLCKMLGYTHDEVKEIIKDENRYSLLIYPDDRPVFRKFVHELAKHGGIGTCEYRMICKDGSLLSVTDTMEAKRSPTGIMYGYSVVTDLSKYTELQQKIKDELDETQAELRQSKIKNLTSQMQPHFLYNALASIREIVLENPEYAAELIYNFTTHLRACIRYMLNDSFIPFGQEIANIQAYVSIEQIRLGDKLEVLYDCQASDFDIIPLSIQPLVENAIRHGICESESQSGTIYIRSWETDDNIIIQVEDTGTGFDFDNIMAEVYAGKRDSTGLFNLIFRFEKLMNAEVTVKSTIGTGTLVTVSIPLRRTS